jgi:multidrug efflux pump subunit AcrA (membrane-fusion protein)
VKKSTIIMIVTLLVAIAIAAVLYTRQSGSGSGHTLEAKRGDLVEAVYGLGTVTSSRTFQLKVGVSSTIEDVYVKEGDQVKARDPLLKIRDTGVATAPFEGTVTSVRLTKGENVFPQAVILTMSDLSNRYIAVSLEQEGALRVIKGQKARLSFESLRQNKYEGQVRAIFPSDGQFIVHVNVGDLPRSVLPGMTADVAIEINQRKGVLMIPLASWSNGKVTVIENRQQKRKDVSIGAIDGQWAEVTGGDVKEGDLLMVRDK